VTLCGSGLLHEVGDWLGRRESLRDPLHEGQCGMNVWRSVIQIGLGRGLLVSCWNTDLEIQPENAFQRYLES